MKSHIGLIKIHYLNKKNKEVNGTITSHIYSLKEFQEAVSFYNYLKENEIECGFNDNTGEVPYKWGSGCIVIVDDIMVTLGNDVDLWVLDVYVK